MQVIIKPEILIALRRHKPIPPEEIAKKTGMSVAELHKLEQVPTPLSTDQADRLARLFNRNWAVFLLSAPPATPTTERDNRSARNQRRALGIRTIDAIDESDYKLRFAVDMSPGFRMDLPVLQPDVESEDLAAQLRAFFGVSMEKQRGVADPDRALELWISELEGRGLLVFQYPLAGTDRVRAFSLHHGHRAAVVLNSGDTQRGRVFSLFHEVAHVLMRHTGLCDLHVGTPEARETYCNRFASYFLLPRAEFNAALRAFVSGTDPEAVASSLSNSFKVSRLAIFTRMRAADLISQEQYEGYHQREVVGFQRRQERGTPRLGYYMRGRLRNGRRFSAEVLDGIANGTVSAFAGFGALGISSNTLNEYRIRVVDGGG